MVKIKFFINEEMAQQSSASFVSFTPGEIVKQGYLFVKRPPRNYWSKLKAWHRRYFVLRDETNDRNPLLEMYERKESITPALGIERPKLTLDLGQCVHIGFTSDSSRFPYALVVVCQGRSPLLLAADDELGARSWMLALGLITHKGAGHGWKSSLIRPKDDERILNRKSSLPDSLHQNTAASSIIVDGSTGTVLPLDYMECGVDTSFAREKFAVTVHPTESSEKAGLSGEVQLVVFSHGIGLARPGQNECFLMWPVAFIRQYRHETVAATGKTKAIVVTLEVGRRCSTGEGIFQFRTQRGQDIIRELKLTVEMWSARKAAAGIKQIKQDARTNSRWSSGRSAPCTPTLALPHSWQKHKGSPSSSKRTSSRRRAPEKEDLNYVFPVFDNNSEGTANGCDMTSPPPSPPPPPPPVLLHSEKNSSKTQSVSNDKDSFKRTSISRVESEETCYVEVFPKGPKQEMFLPSPSIPRKLRSRSLGEEHHGQLNSLKEEQAYIEVLPT